MSFVTGPPSYWAIRPHSSSAVDVLRETFPVALQLSWFHSYVCKQDICVLPSNWSQFPSSVCFLFVFTFTQELHVLHAGFLPQLLNCLKILMAILMLWGGCSWRLASSSGPLLSGQLPTVPAKQVSSEVYGCNSVLCLVASPRIWNPAVSCSLQPKLSLTSISYISCSLIVSSCSSLRVSLSK